jgi:hypothetical protein
MTMQTVKERLEFAIRFAQLDLDRLRPGDWLNLRDDLRAFLGQQVGQMRSVTDTGGVLVSGLDDPQPEDLPIDDFRHLQAEVRSVLAERVDVQPTGERIASPRAIHAEYAVLPHAIYAKGPVHDMTLLTLMHLLFRHRAAPIGRCPECQTIFYRVRKQQYCTRACVHRANVRKWRQTEPGKQYERARSRTRYEARAKPAGSNVKLLRRPRSGKQNAGE